MDIAVEGMNLKAPIPSSVTMQFRAIKLALDNVSDDPFQNNTVFTR
jgi:hypothetical protein